MNRIACYFLVPILVFSLVAAAQSPGAGTLQTPQGEWTWQAYGANIIRFVYQPANYTRHEQVSDAVVMKPGGTPGGAFRVARDGAEGLRLRFDSVRFRMEPLSDSGFNGFRFYLKREERIYGGGERALPLNRRGYRFNLYNNPWYGYSEGADNLNYSVPFLTSSGGYALFFDNPSKGFVDVGKANAGILEYGASSGQLAFYVIFGNYQQILQSYHKLTGNQPLPPRWAMGNLMSRFGYTSQQQVGEIYGSMKKEGIPVDAVIFDLFWFGDSIKGTMGNLEWVNRNRWPDPKKMILDFKKENVQTILVTEPFFVETSRNYTASKPYLAVDSAGSPYYLTDFYFGKGGLVDIFRKDAQQWFWQFYKKQMNLGVEAWWGDLGEPEKHPSNVYHNLKDFGQNRLFSADEVHNIYGHNWTKMLYNYYAKEFPSKRLFSLNRSGFAGSQRFSIFPWTGDVSRSWSGLRSQLPVLLGMSMSGVPYVHSDAGGFAGGEGDPELYTRWLQFAAFTPIFRPHGTALYEVDTAAFSYPSEAALLPQPYRDYAKKVIGLRYALLPYNYTLAYRQAAFGEPLIAPMYYYYPADEEVAERMDQYFWGKNLLVAPVTEKGQTSRPVYLPEGTWYELHTNKQVGGGTEITAAAGMDTIPLYVRGGSFLPFWNPRSGQVVFNTADYRKNNRLVVRYYPSDSITTYALFEDDGVTKGTIGAQKFELLTFSGVRKGNRLTVTIRTSRPSSYKAPREIILETPFALKNPLRAALNGKKLAVGRRIKTAYSYSPGVQYEGLRLSFSGKPLTVVVDIEN